MGNVSTIEITEELEVKCIASVIGNGSVEKLQMRANSAQTDVLRKRYLVKALEILENN